MSTDCISTLRQLGDIAAVRRHRGSENRARRFFYLCRPSHFGRLFLAFLRPSAAQPMNAMVRATASREMISVAGGTVRTRARLSQKKKPRQFPTGAWPAFQRKKYRARRKGLDNYRFGYKSAFPSTLRLLSKEFPANWVNSFTQCLRPFVQPDGINMPNAKCRRAGCPSHPDLPAGFSGPSARG